MHIKTRRYLTPANDWTPLRLNPLVWFDAQSRSQIGGGSPVTNWKSNTGKAILNPTNSPTYTSNDSSASGVPAVVLVGGSNQFMDLTSNYSLTGKRASVFITGMFASGFGNAYCRLIACLDGSGTIDYAQTDGFTVARSASTSNFNPSYNNLNATSVAFTALKKFLLVIVFDGFNCIQYFNGTPIASAVCTQTWAFTVIRIGSDLIGDGASINLYEVAVCNMAMTPQEVQQLRKYTQSKWGTP